MATDLEKVEEREQKRYNFLKAIYDSVGDSAGDEAVKYTEVFEKAGLKHGEGHEIFTYVRDKGFFSGRTGTGWLALSHEGIIEMERSILYPKERTDHFKPGVVQRFYAAVGVVQNAADSAAHVTQNNGGVERALSADQQLVLVRQQRRERVMRLIYDKSEANLRKHISKAEIKEEEGLSESEYRAVYFYLKAEGLVDDTVTGGVFEITQRGIDYVERRIKNPDGEDDADAGRSEQHFYAPVGAVQNAPHSTAYVTQNNLSNSTELLRLIQDLREKVEALDDNQQALEQVNDLEEEAKSASPKKSRIIAAAKYVGDIVKDVGVSVAAEAIVKAAGG
jgi:hypothetical protein